MSVYAIVSAGSKQYWVEPDQTIQVELIDKPEDEKGVVLDQVLFYSDGKKAQVGTPVIEGAKVVCDFVKEVKGPKVIHYQYRRRKDSERKVGHRQRYSELRVKEIKV